MRWIKVHTTFPSPHWPSWFISLLATLPGIGTYLWWLAFPYVFGALVAVPILIGIGIYIATDIKFDFNVPGYSRWQLFQTLHFTTEWKHTFYDTDLNRNIPYAKHAISIDEHREDFARVKWGVPDGRPSRDELGNLTFEQVWFAGNHADIGGATKRTKRGSQIRHSSGCSHAPIPFPTE